MTEKRMRLICCLTLCGGGAWGIDVARKARGFHVWGKAVGGWVFLVQKKRENC